MPERRDSVWVSFVVAGALALSACGAGASDEATHSSRSAISGGENVPSGAWPMVVWLDNGCTGVLLAESLVVFAAHCGANVGSVWLGDSFQVSIDDDAGVARTSAPAGGRQIRARGCVIHPDFELGTATDVAFCDLESAALPADEIVRPALGCARARIVAGAQATLVGFGRSSADDPPGIKRAAVAPVVTTSPSFEIGDDAQGTCAGDSGSPAFVRVTDGAASEWAIAGILSGGVGACGVGYYVDLMAALDWLQSASGVDLNPCFDTNGSWSPSPSCTSPNIDDAGLVRAGPAEPDSSCGPSFLKADAESIVKSTNTGSGCAITRSHESGGAGTWLYMCAFAWTWRLRAREITRKRSRRRSTRTT